MSYCRWSSDNWKSDLYVYASVGDFYSINIAANRTVGDAPEVPPWSQAPLGDDDASKQWWVDWQAAHDTQMKWLETAERQKIDLPYAGESIAVGTAAEAADKLRELQALGYYVPQYAIDELDEEAKEELLGRTV